MKPIVWLGIPVGLFVLMQLVPVGRDHTNPPVTAPVRWDSPATEAIARRACYDCHSNETRWPWYSNVAPISWLVADHVKEGRSRLNFSAFDPGNRRAAHAAEEAPEEVQKGEMPLKQYLPMHPEARLSAEEKAALIRGLTATFAPAGGGVGEEGAPQSGAPAKNEQEQGDDDD
ncbi:MAG: heme-binding domain-containing protein [Candidatus Eisenbacteria bacterium]